MHPQTTIETKFVHVFTPGEQAFYSSTAIKTNRVQYSTAFKKVLGLPAPLSPFWLITYPPDDDTSPWCRPLFLN
jgi:hypothetical protein